LLHRETRRKHRESQSFINKKILLLSLQPKKSMAKNNETWGSSLGMILAMAANAVGFGNFLRFPVNLFYAVVYGKLSKNKRGE